MGTGRAGARIRQAWLFLGVTLLIALAIEAGLTIAFGVKDALSRPDRVIADAYANADWAPAYFDELDRSAAVEWSPYVYWRRKPFQGEYVNVDADGTRRTVAPLPGTDTGPRARRRIFMFGGSTLWGTGARDAFTIPSLVTARLQGDGIAVDMTNFGENGYVSTQEVIALTRQLQQGQRPDVVIFYDGVNDTYSAYQQRVAGIPQNEFNRIREFNLSQPSGLRPRSASVARDAIGGLRTTRAIAGVLKATGLTRDPAVDPNPLRLPNPAPLDAALARSVVSTYQSNMEIVRALGRAYGFTCLFYWQPTIFQKPHLTAYEAGRKAERQALEPFLQQTYDAMRQSNPNRNPDSAFHDLSLMLAAVREPLYLDWSHLGESGHELIATRIAADVRALLAAGAPVR